MIPRAWVVVVVGLLVRPCVFLFFLSLRPGTVLTSANDTYPGSGTPKNKHNQHARPPPHTTKHRGCPGNRQTRHWGPEPEPIEVLGKSEEWLTANPTWTKRTTAAGGAPVVTETRNGEGRPMLWPDSGVESLKYLGCRTLKSENTSLWGNVSDGVPSWF